MTPRPDNRIRHWTVGLRVSCDRALCTTVDEAAVTSTSCEDARQGVMRVLRYRGWTIAPKQGAQLCPTHTGPHPKCGVCQEPTPPAYSERLGLAHYLQDDEQIKCAPVDSRICDKCQRDARDRAWSRMGIS